MFVGHIQCPCNYCDSFYGSSEYASIQMSLSALQTVLDYPEQSGFVLGNIVATAFYSCDIWDHVSAGQTNKTTIRRSARVNSGRPNPPFGLHRFNRRNGHNYGVMYKYT
jgi:hypothetical protein